MLTDLGSIALAYTNTAVALHRQSDGAYNPSGDWVPGSSEELTIQATVQPVSGRQLMDMPEGLRTEARMTLWTVETIAGNEQVVSDGIRYRVIFVWPRHEGGFYRAALGQLAND